MKAYRRSSIRTSPAAALLLALLSVAEPGPAAGEELPQPRFFPAVAWDVSLESLFLQYREFAEGENGSEEELMEDTSLLLGFRGNLRLSSGAGPALLADVEAAYGAGEYDGETWEGDPARADSETTLGQVRIAGGYAAVFNGWALMPYAGVGYRYLWNDTEGPGGYRREVQYLYSPVGLELTARAGPRRRWSLVVEYDHLWRGRVRSRLSDANPAYNDPEVTQPEGRGVRIEGRFTLLWPGVSLGLGPFFRYWWVDDSDSAALTEDGAEVGRVYEPRNETGIFGFQAAVGF